MPGYVPVRQSAVMREDCRCTCIVVNEDMYCTLACDLYQVVFVSRGRASDMRPEMTETVYFGRVVAVNMSISSHAMPPAPVRS